MTWAFVTLAFLVGVLVGRQVDDLFHLARSVANDRTLTMNPERRRNLLTWALAAVLVFNAAIGALLVVTRIQQTKFTGCVVDYNQRFSAAYKARLITSQQATDALDRLVLAVDSQDRATFRDALTNYVALRTQAKASAKANPYPALPDQFCGNIR